MKRVVVIAIPILALGAALLARAAPPGGAKSRSSRIHPSQEPSAPLTSAVRDPHAPEEKNPVSPPPSSHPVAESEPVARRPSTNRTSEAVDSEEGMMELIGRLQERPEPPGLTERLLNAFESERARVEVSFLGAILRAHRPTEFRELLGRLCADESPDQKRKGAGWIGSYPDDAEALNLWKRLTAEEECVEVRLAGVGNPPLGILQSEEMVQRMQVDPDGRVRDLARRKACADFESTSE